jgi:hypothetical protein
MGLEALAVEHWGGFLAQKVVLWVVRAALLRSIRTWSSWNCTALCTFTTR